MNEDDTLPEKPDVIGYSVKIDEKLYKRLEKHLRVLKHVEQSGLSKQKWVTDAVIEKLSKDAKSEVSEIPKDHYLVLRFNKPIHEKIESIVEYQKRFKSSSNKKQWILEAIQEKLESEEPKTKKFLDEIAKKRSQ